MGQIQHQYKIEALIKTANAYQLNLFISFESILVPRGRAPFGQYQESRPLASGQVQHRKSAIYGLPVTLSMLRAGQVCFWSQSIVFTKPLARGPRGRDSWC